MEKKRSRVIVSMLAAVIMGISLFATVMPVKAATTYTPVAGTSCNFNKYLIMDAGDTVPNVTFEFTVAPGAARSSDTSDNSVMQVLPGVGTPTISAVTFSPSDGTKTEVGDDIDVRRPASDRATGLTAANGVQLENGEKYATKQATVSFSGISFNEPGIYRYIITETANADHVAAGIMHDNDTDRVLDVYVKDNGSGTLVVDAYVMHKNDDDVAIGDNMGSADVAAAAAALDDKTDGFTNEYNSKDLKIEKEVSGNQASRDKYFELTVKVEDVADADIFVVSLAADTDDKTNDGNADAISGTTAATIAANQGKTNPTSVTGAQLKTGVKFYLQHGQSVVIRGLAPNATYTVTENAEDYKSAEKSGDTNRGTIGTVAGTDKMATAGFTNTRNGIIPTGILLSATPWIILAVIVIAGIIFFAYRSKRRYED